MGRGASQACGGLRRKQAAGALSGARIGCRLKEGAGRPSKSARRLSAEAAGPVAAADRYGHPAEKRFRKQLKSSTFSTGATVLPSQLAYGSPAENRFRKQLKSSTFRMGLTWLPSQL